jgi:hypothetical protein
MSSLLDARRQERTRFVPPSSHIPISCSCVLQIRLFARDRPLSLSDSLEAIALDSEPLLISIFDSSLLVYTADNTLHHLLIRQTQFGATRLRMCGSIGFEGVVADPSKVRGMSWLVPKSQQSESRGLREEERD